MTGGPYEAFPGEGAEGKPEATAAQPSSVGFLGRRKKRLLRELRAAGCTARNHLRLRLGEVSARRTRL